MLEIIHKRKKKDYFMQANLHLLQLMENEARKQFLESLKVEDNLSSIPQKTDFEALKKAKKQFNMK